MYSFFKHWLCTNYGEETFRFSDQRDHKDKGLGNGLQFIL